jgi:hypothetical protein
VWETSHSVSSKTRSSSMFGSSKTSRAFPLDWHGTGAEKVKQTSAKRKKTTRRVIGPIRLILEI